MRMNFKWELNLNTSHARSWQLGQVLSHMLLHEVLSRVFWLMIHAFWQDCLVRGNNGKGDHRPAWEWPSNIAYHFDLPSLVIHGKLVPFR